jgi:hypothetical protein
MSFSGDFKTNNILLFASTQFPRYILLSSLPILLEDLKVPQMLKKMFTLWNSGKKGKEKRMTEHQ